MPCTCQLMLRYYQVIFLIGPQKQRNKVQFGILKLISVIKSEHPDLQKVLHVMGVLFLNTIEGYWTQRVMHSAYLPLFISDSLLSVPFEFSLMILAITLDSSLRTYFEMHLIIY